LVPYGVKVYSEPITWTKPKNRRQVMMACSDFLITPNTPHCPAKYQ
jgi:hypothetical protein